MPAHHLLRCRSCGQTFEPGRIDYRCDTCGGELVVKVTLPADPADEWSGCGMWGFADFLPLSDQRYLVSLGEGGTALLSAGSLIAGQIGAASVRLKCEHLNPTGSFKDRLASVALSLCRERSLLGVVGTSSGNGGAAAAAYGARADLPVTIFTLPDVAAEKLVQMKSLGARVYGVVGLGHHAASTVHVAQAVARAAAATGWFPFLTGGRYSPEAMEGAKTIAHEISRDAPDTTVVYVPVGGGGLLAALGRGFLERPCAGGVPRLIAVQPVGCATLRLALAGDLSGVKQTRTHISGLQVAQLFDGQGALYALEMSRGHLTEVSDDQVFEAQRLLAHSGILVEPAGAAALAGALVDTRTDRLGGNDHAVIVATGAGYKDRDALLKLSGSLEVPTVHPSQVEEVLNA